MGHFDNCTPDQRFSVTHAAGWHETGTEKIIIDWDQRRFIAVATPWKEEDEDFFLHALAEHIDDISSDVIQIEVGEDGELLKTTTDLVVDPTRIPFYPSPLDYMTQVQHIRRDELIEVSRMGVQVDLCEHTSTTGSPPQQVAFKYYFNEGNMEAIWDEANCLSRIPRHPNIIPFHGLVIDRVEGQDNDKVVGFTTPFVPGGTIEDNISRPFKLKHLRQLTSTIDYLNLELGICHSDITPYNLLIDPRTDNIIIFDFNLAARLDWEEEHPERQDYDPDRDDVKFTAFTLYEIITRDTHLRDENDPHELDIAMVLDTPAWEKHEEVVLDAPVADYRRQLDEWMTTRRARSGDGAQEEKQQQQTLSLWKQAPGAFDWPPLPELPEVMFFGAMRRIHYQYRRDMVRHGANFLTWQRPPSCALPLAEGKKLLATGKLVEASK
ncbi:hypothetical protein KVR01_003828 [Diaporthe batatas]|uniref:uncharacterized protein n=1 Tax=Diaporthe batatas TaxID=748121 RepID=UPI001D05B046|nr:uncharacterized protein KVR01_003828 [Diaporthe batatas]KAG8168139.1 hypothetical protein KVR01_003828 [Diaporthe batatas]